MSVNYDHVRMVMGMRSTHLSRCPAPHAQARAAHEPPGHMAAPLDITFCDMPHSWLTRTAPPFGAEMGRGPHAELTVQNGVFCRVAIFWRMRGGVQQLGTTASGRDRYVSGLRDRPNDLQRASIAASSTHRPIREGRG